VSTKVIGSYEQLLELVEREHIDQIIVALPDRRGKLPIDALMNCKLQGIEVTEGSSFYERISGKILLENLRPSWIIFSSGFKISPLMHLLKRLSDFFLAVIGLLLTAPLMILIGILIKLDSRGPALFSQERVGEGGAIFTLLKFRSMVVNAEALSGPVFAGEADPRVTRVGRLLRATRLDELPQLFNILKGEMSFVGPRPERLYFVEQFAKEIPFYSQRLSVKPGLTGWAQVNYTYGANQEDAVEKLRLDLYYIKNMSLVLDLLIILKTAKITLLCQGAR
jgi:sugar transferase (PEP-CTERM system associated)